MILDVFVCFIRTCTGVLPLTRSLGTQCGHPDLHARSANNCLCFTVCYWDLCRQLPVAELEEQYKAERAKLVELGVELEDEDGEDTPEDEEEEEEEDVLTKAVSRARKHLTTVLTAAVKGGDYHSAGTQEPVGCVSIVYAGDSMIL